jgi:hypothetical protein
MKNLEGDGGTNYRIGKDYDDSADTVGFRSLMQLTGDGATIIKPYGESGAGNTINFRRIKEKASPARIQVTTEGDAIKIHGNGVSGTLTHVTCEGTSTVILEWDDGLIISGSASFTAGCTGSGSGSEIP